MAIKLRTDFPQDVVVQREQVQADIRRLIVLDTLETVRQAIRLQMSWLERYPDDYVMWDIGEVLGKLEDAILTTEPEPALASVR